MNCPNCNEQSKKNGKDRKGNQKFRCLSCNKVFTLTPKLEGKKLSADKIELCVKMLVEGTSVRSTERVTGVHRDTILRLLETVGERCLKIQETLVKGVNVHNVEADEIWGFVGMKQKTANAQGLGDSEQVGSVWTYTAIEKHSKLIVAWHLGQRSEQDTLLFLEKLYAATEASRPYQLSTDAYKGYDHTVSEILGTKVHYGQIIKIFGKTAKKDETRYSAPEIIGIKKKVMFGNPVKANISTSIVERNNLTMRMSMRRLTRLTNGFSKKHANLNYALALNFAYYNFCRIHKTLRCTPAMEAGITKSVWTLRELIGITE